jgi:hypothetical protein
LEQRKNYWSAAKSSGLAPSKWARHWLDFGALGALRTVAESPHPAHPAEHALVGVSE